jgi:hypothetical protein
VGEVLPLPPLSTLGPDGAFSRQRDDGTRPVDELDGRVGWHARARYGRADAFRVQAAFTDNRGDRLLYKGQYAWATRYGQAGLEAHLGPRVTFVSEAALGDTLMGPFRTGGSRVDVRFWTVYALGSWSRGPVRLSARYDRFENEDRDGTAEPGQESGWAWTASLFWRPHRLLRLGAEYVDLRAQREAAAFSGQSPDTDARRGLLEVRLIF